MEATEYLQLFRKVKIASAGTVDQNGHPQSRIINVMLCEPEGLYIVTSRGKPFHQQLTRTGEIALSAMCPDCQSLRLWGRLRKADKHWVDKVFEANPGMNEVYPGDSRYALDAFLIYQGYGEWFDLLNYPIQRETFSFGGVPVEEHGFKITETCTGCGACAEACPQKCIKPVEDGVPPYVIQWEHCLQCGLCAETCAFGAIHRLHNA